MTRHAMKMTDAFSFSLAAGSMTLGYASVPVLGGAALNKAITARIEASACRGDTNSSHGYLPFDQRLHGAAI